VNFLYPVSGTLGLSGFTKRRIYGMLDKLKIDQKNSREHPRIWEESSNGDIECWQKIAGKYWATNRWPILGSYVN
jgi:hypothetical protein